MAPTEHPQESTRQPGNAQNRRPTPVSEEDFLSRVGLNPDSDQDRRVYLLMKTEALHAVRDPSSLPVEEIRFRQAMSTLYRFACLDTRKIYGAYEDAALESPGNNWIIRWLIWQALAQAKDHELCRATELGQCRVRSIRSVSGGYNIQH